MAVATSLLLLASLALPAQEAPQDVDPTRFELTPLARGLDRPMELTVAPDGRVFWIELGGKLRIWKPDTGMIVEAGQLEVFVEQENGLIGLALDPDFARNQRLYLMYSPVEYPGQHLSRFTMDGDRLDRSSEQLILRFEEQRRECCHHAGSLEFGPNGLLFIATGDNTHPGGDAQGFAPLDERPDREPFDAQKGPANTQSLSGKILRIRLTEDGYEIPEGNLFADPAQGRPEIYVMGCRNPWRIGFDQQTGYLYWGEVGPDAGERGRPLGHPGWTSTRSRSIAFKLGRPEKYLNDFVGPPGARLAAPARLRALAPVAGDRLAAHLHVCRSAPRPQHTSPPTQHGHATQHAHATAATAAAWCPATPWRGAKR